MSATRSLIVDLVAARLDGARRERFETQMAAVAGTTDSTAFAAALSQASRFAPRGPLEPGDAERQAANSALAGWDPERWTILEAWRVALVLSRADLEASTAALAIEDAFRYADEGETRALYRSLAHLPDPERFVWRAGEGCRTNIVPVFEAVACDTPYPVRHFDDVAWRQLVIKAVFIGAPLWRVFGLDGRLSEELARMALDLVDERRSASREVQPELWLCLGEHGGDRGIASIERELESGDSEHGRAAAALALARAGELERLKRYASRPELAAAVADALNGPVGQTAFRSFDPRAASRVNP